MKVILYSTGCPRCNVLVKKLNENGIGFEEENDVDTILNMGIKSVPVLSVDGKLMDFMSAVAWLNDSSAGSN